MEGHVCMSVAAITHERLKTGVWNFSICLRIVQCALRDVIEIYPRGFIPIDGRFRTQLQPYRSSRTSCERFRPF